MIDQIQKTYKNILYKNQFVQKLCNMNFVKVIETKIIWNFLQPQKNEKICDIACGIGLHDIEMACRGCHVYGIDISDGNIKIAKSLSKNLNCHFFVGDAENLPFKSDFFDKVISACALEHFNNDKKALSEMSRVLRDDGILVLTLEGSAYKGNLKKYVQENFQVVNFYSVVDTSNKLENVSLKLEENCNFINSSLSGYFYRLNVSLSKYRFGGELAALIFPIAFLLAIVSDRMVSRNKEGYRLAVKARKIKSIY